MVLTFEHGPRGALESSLCNSFRRAPQRESMSGQTIRIMGTARSVSGKWDAAFDWSMNEKAVAAGHVRRKPRKKKRRKRKAPERGSPGHRKDGRHKFA